MVLVLQTELSDREMNPTELISHRTIMPVPLSQHIEGRHAKGKPCRKVTPNTMSHLLDVADSVHHREHSLHHHTHVPLTSLVHQHVLRVTCLAVEAMVGKHS